MTDDERQPLIEPTELIDTLTNSVEQNGRLPLRMSSDAIMVYYLYDIAQSLRTMLGEEMEDDE